MTPNELLTSVKGRFTPLLVVEPETLKSLLIRALTTYQDRAGHIRRMRIDRGGAATFKVPDDYLELVHVSDDYGCMVDAEPIDDEIEMRPGRNNRYPFTMSYLVNLREVNLDVYQIPRAIVGYLDDYLYHLINAQNAVRMRRVSIAGKLDTSDIPDEATLYNRKIELEAAMSQNRAIITGATIA